MAMDWVEGTDLATLLRERGRPGLAPSSVLAYLAQAAEALTHLHSQDPPVLHGDVKPANLILTKGGRVKLVDFGMSSAPGAARPRIGTPGFRAPELAADGMPSRASDVYSLAATAFALLSGSAPSGVLPSWDGIEPAQAEAARGCAARWSGDRSRATAGDAGRARAEPPERLGRRIADRRDDVLPIRHRGLDGALGERSRGDGRGARPPRRDHRRARGGARRSVPQVHGRRRLDGLGVRVGASGARRGGCCHPRPAGRGVARRATSRGPLRTAHGRGRAPRRRLLRADPQPRGPTARTGGRRSGLRIRGDGDARGPSTSRPAASWSTSVRTGCADCGRRRGSTPSRGRGSARRCPPASPRIAACSPSSPTTGASSSGVRRSSRRSSRAWRPAGCWP